MGDEPGYFCACIDAMAVSRGDYDALLARVAGLEADAARYRVLRAGDQAFDVRDERDMHREGDELDALCDAALEPKP